MLVPDIRVGIGYDVHQLAEGRELWLGGVLIPHSHGSLGHSDADVILHAICDALLGAVSMRDIGFHFSDKDAQYKGIDSKILLKQVVDMLANQGFHVGNIDCALVLEAPKIAPYIMQMQEAIAEVVGISKDRISIKATTSEKMGFVGNREGLEAQAVALIYRAS
jgi:2-C-methyl-D-erythritol 2,4-cyclodiphosphate synthase